MWILFFFVFFVEITINLGALAALWALLTCIPRHLQNPSITQKKYEASPCEFIDTENWLWDDITSGV